MQKKKKKNKKKKQQQKKKKKKKNTSKISEHSLCLFFLFPELFFIEAELVNKVGRHLLQLIIREGLMNKPARHNVTS